MMTACASCVLPSSVRTTNGRCLRSTSTTSSVTIRVPKLTACCRISSISSGPVTACLPFVDVHVLQPLGLDRRLEKLLQVARREAGVVLDLGRERELAQRQRAGEAILFGDRAFEHERLELGPRRVDGGRPTGRPAADDDHSFGHNRSCSQVIRRSMARIIGLRSVRSNGSACSQFRGSGIVKIALGLLPCGAAGIVKFGRHSDLPVAGAATMNLLTVVAGSAAVLLVAYFTYGRFLSRFLQLDRSPADAGRRAARRRRLRADRAEVSAQPAFLGDRRGRADRRADPGRHVCSAGCRRCCGF